MTNQQMNVAIAEACGWEEGVERYVQNLPLMKAPPDYCTDLNAMHEAEEMLTGVLWRDYFERLQRHGKASGIRASARQRAEAFLRTLGKWEEVQP